MSNQAATYDGTVERTSDGGWIRFERRLGYAVADVWDAVTNPSRLASWWLPFDADISVDLQEGGQMVFAAKDAPVEFTCTILRVDPPKLLEHTHAGWDDVFVPAQRHYATIGLAPAPEA